MKLYLVPTPIGNLEDITLRALRILREEADVILAEDTRTSGKLMKHYDISKPMIAFHLNNEHQQVRHIAERIANGEHMALVTDAGTPAISDPGFMLVRECISMDIPVECLPATAFVPALVNSGLSADHFIFEGFLPHKKGRQTKIRQIAENEYTTILYESPFRLVKTLEQLIEVAGNDRRVSVARELTKVFEENARGTLSEIRDYFSSKEVKGEIVIVLEGKKKTKEEE